MVNETGRREVVQDRLRRGGRELLPERNLALTGVRPPNTPNLSGVRANSALIQESLGRLQQIVAEGIAKEAEDAELRGKVMYMQGVAEEDMLAEGNLYTKKGYMTLKAQDDVQRWYSNALVDMDNHLDEDSAEYMARIEAERSRMLDEIQDPDARKIAVAAFETYTPRLAHSQATKASQFNREKRKGGFYDTITSTGVVSADASYRSADSDLAVSNGIVGAVLQPSDRDRDIGIRTILGEALGEGAEGMAAVAHVLKNRALDGRWPTSIANVALQKNQFSAWNRNGSGNNNVNITSGPLYEKAGKIFDLVMSGKHVDPTGGATHYYSPKGMQAYKDKGLQSHLIPPWLEAEKKRSGGTVTIGGHVFVGRTSGTRSNVPEPAPEETAKRVIEHATMLGISLDEPTANRIGQVFDLFAVDETSGLNIAAFEEGVAETPVLEAGGPTELNSLIEGYKGLTDADKAEVVARAAIDQFNAGNGDWFTDAGGMAVLNRLGASPELKSQVLAAKRRWEDAEDAKFDVARLKAEQEILSLAEEGADEDVVLGKLDELVKQNVLSEKRAVSLFRSAASTIRRSNAQDASIWSDKAFLKKLGAVYQQAVTGAVDLDTAMQQAEQIVTEAGGNTSDLTKVMSRVFELDQQHQNNLRAEAKARAAEQRKSEQAIAEVAHAVASGTGLANVTGTVRYKTEAGQWDSMSAREYGIKLIKDRFINQYREHIADGRMTEAEASSAILRDTYAELSKHGVVDKQFQNQIRGALSGTLLTPDKKVDPAAIEAYETYQLLTSDPRIPEKYIGQLFNDEYTSVLLETTRMIESSNTSTEHALLRAHALVNDPTNTPEVRLEMSRRNRSIIREKLDDVFDELAVPSVLDFGAMNHKHKRNPDAVRAFYEDPQNRARAEAYLVNKADAYTTAYPGTPPEVALELAKKALLRDGAYVNGNLIINRGKPLEQKMGIGEWGELGPDRAVRWFLDTVGSHPSYWGDKFKQHWASQARIFTTYNEDQNMFMFQLEDPDSPGQPLLGSTKFVPADSIGKAFLDEMSKPTAVDRGFRAIVGEAVNMLSEIVVHPDEQ